MGEKQSVEWREESAEGQEGLQEASITRNGGSMVRESAR
jgi:hypothetical protein